MNLSNRIAIVTGGASGMGLATAERLAKAHAKVVLFDRSDSVLDIAKQLGGQGYVVDVTDTAAVERAVSESASNVGIPSILVNCAGIAPAKRIVGKEGAMPLEDFTQVININLIATFNMMRLVATQMSQRALSGDETERGVIINTASIAAFEGQIGQSAYAASKGAIVSMTLPAARELARFCIRVMTIAPGIVATPMMTKMPAEVQQSLADAVPFPKRMAEPREFADLVVHIVENPMLNGSVIRLDGALRMA